MSDHRKRFTVHHDDGSHERMTSQEVCAYLNKTMVGGKIHHDSVTDVFVIVPDPPQEMRLVSQMAESIRRGLKR